MTFLLAWPPVAWMALKSLEGQYPRHTTLGNEPQAIVVLASYVSPPTAERPSGILGSETYQRCLHAAWLQRQRRSLPLLASGGGNPAYSLAMRSVLAVEAAPGAAIWTEERSSSTHEAAVFSARILRRQNIGSIVLVTDAYHMKRAESCFRKEGFEVMPGPCHYHAFTLSLENLLPQADAIRQNENVLHEWVGLLWYRIRAWI